VVVSGAAVGCELVFPPGNDPGLIDSDHDGVRDGEDNCPDAANPYQDDEDDDGFGDACDVCPGIPDPDQLDTDPAPEGPDQVGNACDPHPLVGGDQALLFDGFEHPLNWEKESAEWNVGGGEAVVTSTESELFAPVRSDFGSLATAFTVGATYPWNVGVALRVQELPPYEGVHCTLHAVDATPPMLEVWSRDGAPAQVATGLLAGEYRLRLTIRPSASLPDVVLATCEVEGDLGVGAKLDDVMFDTAALGLEGRVTLYASGEDARYAWAFATTR